MLTTSPVYLLSVLGVPKVPNERGVPKVPNALDVLKVPNALDVLNERGVPLDIQVQKIFLMSKAVMVSLLIQLASAR